MVLWGVEVKNGKHLVFGTVNLGHLGMISLNVYWVLTGDTAAQTP